MADVKSLNFAVTRFLMKLFRSANSDVINEYRLTFNFLLPSEMVENRTVKFESKFVHYNSLQSRLGTYLSHC